jgi:predicted AAA+ superfamily ATPase
MDYEEFRWALSDETTIPLIKEAFDKKKSLGDEINRKLMRDFRLYMLVGGMPQAVNEYIDTNNLGKVDQIKRNILDLYEEDFRKIDPSGRASLLFNAIPSELSKSASRYQVSSVDAHSRSARIGDIIADILDSMTVYSAYHADDPGVGFALNKNPDKFKLFLADTGLFVTLAFKDKDFTENTIYERLLSDKLSANLGSVYENVVAQMLRAVGNELFYHTMPSDTSNNNYEIDFLLSRKNKICPIEVKSSGYKTHASLDRFTEKFKGRIAEKYLVYTKDLRKSNDIIMLPMYMVQFI